MRLNVGDALAERRRKSVRASRGNREFRLLLASAIVNEAFIAHGDKNCRGLAVIRRTIKTERGEIGALLIRTNERVEFSRSIQRHGQLPRHGPSSTKVENR